MSHGKKQNKKAIIIKLFFVKKLQHASMSKFTVTVGINITHVPICDKNVEIS